MPSFSAVSSIRVASEDHVLRLKITHNLVHGSPSDVVYSVKGRLPRELDVLWLSNISISLSGSLDGNDVPSDAIVRSGLALHLQTQFKANADRLGLNNVSRPFVDDEDGLSKLTLTPARSLPNTPRPHANLVSLHLAYIWRTVAERSNNADSGHLVEEIHPFSPTLFLPAEVLLNRVTGQFLTYHLVNRYPLIFGPWCKRLDIEMAYFPSIGHSIMDIMTRSGNSRFLSSCRRLLKMARRQHKFTRQTVTAALAFCADDAVSETSEERMNSLPAMPVLTDEQVLCESLEQLFRMGAPYRRFKPVARVAPHFVSLPEDDDMLQCTPDAGVDDDNLWIELPEIAMSPCALDSSPPLPEDEDVFAQEAWPEGEMWRLHATDEGLAEQGYDAQSDESLICDSISLASITTRSSQADPVSLYHHQDGDGGELDPASSGLRYKVSQLTYPGSLAALAHPTRDHEQVIHQDDSEWLRTLYEWPDGDEDSILWGLDVPDRTEVMNFDEALV